MLIKAQTLTGYQLDSLNGKIGLVKEFYFDDRFWIIRYLIADTGKWLPGRQVLLSPYALGAVNGSRGTIAIALTKDQIKDSPSLDSDKPVSHQYEEDFHGYYGYPGYWGGAYSWGAYPYLARNREEWRKSPTFERTWDPHLRSTRAVTGNHIQAADGELGHVEDFIIDDDTWAIRYLVINTRNWWLGKMVLISPQWIERVDWIEGKVFVSVSRETVKRAPEFTTESQLNREFETRLHDHYNRQGYWIDEEAHDHVSSLD